MTIRFLKGMWLLAGLLAIALSVSAQSEVVSAHVPFAFVAGGITLPAGDYRVDRGEAQSVLVIQNGAGNSAAVLTMIAQAPASTSNASLIFERRGSAMFLTSVRLQGDEVRVLYTSDSRPAHASLKSATLASPVLH